MDDRGFARAQWAYENRMPPEPVEGGLCECGEFHAADDPPEGCEEFRHDPDGEAEAAAEARADRERDEPDYDRYYGGDF